MDSKGHIHIDQTDEEVEKKDLVEIPKSDLERVVNMNRHQRRAWLKQQRVAAKAKAAE